MFKLSSNSIKNREGVNEKLIAVNDRAIQITVIDFGVPQDGGVRTAERQRELYEKGASNADGVINLSHHQSGNALDFYAYVNGAASWQHDHLAMVGAAHLQAASELGIKIKWGGLWKSKNPKIINGIPYGWDMAHIELIGE